MGAFEYEVIVTDDSKENLARRLIEERYNWVRWIEGPKRGPAANRNNGAKQAKGEWLVFMDDDCLPATNILSAYQQALASYKEIKVFEGSIKADREQQSFIEECPLNHQGGYLWACNFMIDKKLFETLNGFDERFPYAAMEDVDLHYRLKKKGIKCFFLEDAIVIHPWRVQKNLYSLTKVRFKSTLYFLEKHPERRKDFNSIYFLRLFYHGFIKNNFKKGIPFRFRGFFAKSVHDFMLIYFAIYMLIRRTKGLHLFV
jgi:GT2 family glycosyltransferase